MDLAFPLHTHLIQNNWEEVRKCLHDGDDNNYHPSHDDKIGYENYSDKNQSHLGKLGNRYNRIRSSFSRKIKNSGIQACSIDGTRLVSSLGLVVVRDNSQRKEQKGSLLNDCGPEENVSFKDDRYKDKISDESESLVTYPLHLACSSAVSAPVDIIKDILQADTSICSKQDARGRLPLHYILESRKVMDSTKDELESIAEIVELLLGIYPDGAMVSENQSNRLPLHIACNSMSLFKSERTCNRVIRALIEAHPDSLRHFDDEYGCIPLHFLCKMASPDKCMSKIIKVMLLASPETALLRDRQDRVALHYATKQIFLCKESISVLLACNPEAAMIKDSSGQLPIHYALMERKNYNRSQKHICADMNQGEVIKELLLSYRRGARVKDMNGLLPLSLACRNNAPYSVVAQLIDSFPQASKESDSDNRLPLHWACHNKDVSELVVEELLLQHKDGILQEESKYGLLPLHVACRAGVSEAVVSLLLSACQKAARMVDDSGSLPLHYACQGCSPIGVIIALLLAFPHSALIKDYKGYSPLEISKVKSRDETIIDALSANPSRWASSSVVGLIWDNPYTSKRKKHSRVFSSSTCESISSLVVDNHARDIICVVCLERRVSNVLYPCGHACLCDECASPSKLNALKHICPIGRCRFDGCVKVFGKIIRPD